MQDINARRETFPDADFFGWGRKAAEDLVKELATSGNHDASSIQRSAPNFIDIERQREKSVLSG